MTQLIDLTLSELRAALARGETTAREATAACLERITATEPTVKALLLTRADEALAECC